MDPSVSLVKTIIQNLNSTSCTYIPSKSKSIDPEDLGKIIQKIFDLQKKSHEIPLREKLSKKITKLPFSILFSTFKNNYYIPLPIAITQGSVSKATLVVGVYFKNDSEITTKIFAKVPTTKISEIDPLEKIKQAYSLPTYDRIETKNKIILIQELEKLKLSDFIRFKKNVSGVTCKQIAKHLENLHQNNILYGDLRPETIAINEQMIHFTFFANSKDLNKFLVYSIGSNPCYNAPEIIENLIIDSQNLMKESKFHEPLQPLTLKVDMWCLGCVFYQITYKKACPWFSTLSELIHALENLKLIYKEIFFDQTQDNDLRNNLLKTNIDAVNLLFSSFQEKHKKTLQWIGNTPMENLLRSLLQWDENNRFSAEKTFQFLDTYLN